MSVVKRNEVRELAAKLHSDRKQIVFTNGCFDLLHRGHVAYLNAARALGDVLIVGMNSDASVRRLKGEERPVVEQEDRAMVLGSLRAVDHVVIFDEDTPYDLIAEIEPNVLVKGGDWSPENIVGADLVSRRGGFVTTIPFVPGRSTSALVAKLRAL
jgi:rfaE bifunctional protein nucleotidyltransferase chain/domain